MRTEAIDESQGTPRTNPSILFGGVALTLPLLALPLLANPSRTPRGDLNPEQRSTVVEEVAQNLAESYVFPAIGQQCGEHLRSLLKDGQFDSSSQPQAFASALTVALQSVSEDKHMRVSYDPTRPQLEDGEEPGSVPRMRLASLRESNFGFERLERMEGNVGYVDMRSFSPIAFGRDTAAGSMAFLANADALIFDMRQNGGGDPEMVQFVCSYLFEERTHLNSLYWRKGDQTQEFWTLDEIPGKRRGDVPVFVLTSKYTFSAAEEFTYNLKTRERATVVGETTGGGANPGEQVSLGEDFYLFVPTGRAINPVTGTNWEGVGIEPDIAVPANKALAEALVEARRAAQDYREWTERK